MKNRIPILSRLSLILMALIACFFPPFPLDAYPGDTGLGLPGSKFCPALTPPSGTVVTVSTVGGLVSAIDNAAAGTTIRVVDGTYNLDGVTLQFNVPNVTLRSASGNREAVILDGNYNDAVSEMILILSSNVTIADLTIRRAYYHPIHVTSTTSSDTLNTMIYNVHIIDPGEQAIKINPYTQAGAAHFTDNGTVACSHIELTNAGRPYIRNNCYTGGIDGHQSRGWAVRDNLIEGFWCNDGLSEHAVHFWVTSRDTLVERNLLRNNARGVGYGMRETIQYGAQRTYSDNPCPSAGGGYVDHYDGIVRNNFIFADSSGLFASEFGFDCGICLWQACGARALHNSVASTQPPFSSIEWFLDNTDVDITNNLVTHNLRDRGGTAHLSGNLINRPLTLFVGNGTGGDLHLNPATAAVAINKVVAPADAPQDIDGSNRPSGFQADVGADEVAFLEVVPASRIIEEGGQTTFTILVTAPAGFSGNVNLAAPSPSPQLLVTLNPASVTPPGQSVMTVRDLHAAPLPTPVNYTITVTGTGTGYNHSVQAQLLVGGDLIYLPLTIRN